MPTPEEFDRWLKADPKNYQQFLQTIKRFLDGSDGNVPQEFLDTAHELIQKQNLSGVLGRVQEKMKGFEYYVLERPIGSILEKDRLARGNAFMDEICDAMLELPEPHRTGFLTQLLPSATNSAPFASNKVGKFPWESNAVNAAARTGTGSGLDKLSLPDLPHPLAVRNNLGAL